MFTVDTDEKYRVIVSKEGRKMTKVKKVGWE